MSGAPETLRIASYNIRKAVGTDRRRDPNRILDVIAELAADVVVLQEADRRLGARPSALPVDQIGPRTGLVAIDASPNEVGIGWHGNAVFVRADASVDAIRRLDLPGIEPRGALVVDLRLGNRALRVTGMHLGLVRASRRQQLTALLEQLNALDDTPTVVAGDLNEWSQSVGLGRMARHFSIHAPGKTYHAKLPLAALDRIALDDSLVLLGGGVLDTAVTRLASDHLPIWLDVAFRS